MNTVNELSTVILTLTFTNEQGLPVIPTSGTYIIYDINGECIMDETSFAPDSSIYEITIPADYNHIINRNNSCESRIVTITWVRGAIKGAIEFRYSIKRLKYLIR